MSNGRDELVSLTELKHAPGIVELFEELPMRFESYFDEVYHSNPNYPSNPAEAGIIDAKQSPPAPSSESKTPTDALSGNYIESLYGHAESFFEITIENCREKFDVIRQSIEDLLASTNQVWRYDWKASRMKLEKAIDDWRSSHQDCEMYARNNEKVIGNRMLNPKPRSMMLFVCSVLFIVVFEFVWVWYFLSEQLGFSAAISGSMGAATAVVCIAGLYALSLANVEKDVDSTRRKIAFGCIGFCIALFLFSLGLLSAWRADSTNNGFAFIIDGYRSMTQLDVFITALINLSGVVLLTYEFKRLICPYPLYHYGERVKKVAYKYEKVEEEKAKMEKKLNARERKIEETENEIKILLDKLEQLIDGAESNIGTAARNLGKKVSEIRKIYVEKNVEFRTVDAFPKPKWFTEESDEFTLRSIKIDQKIDELIKHLNKKSHTDSWKKQARSQLEGCANSARKEINETKIWIEQMTTNQPELLNPISSHHT